MAFRRTANAIVSQPGIEFERWMDEIRANHQSATSEDKVVRVAKTVLRKCDPKQYLLSHSTIVASVDCYEPEGVQTGRFYNRDVECDRKYANFRIKPECQDIINNNCCPAGTMILMADGTEKLIEDIVVDDLVISHTGAVRKVLETFVHQHRGWTYEVHRRGDRRPLTLTGEHPVWSSRPKKIGARTVDAGEFGWVSAGLLRKGDLVHTPKLVGESASSDITIGKAKLLGYYLAEGHLHRQKPYRVRKEIREEFPDETHNIPVGVGFSLHKEETDTLASDITSLMHDEFSVDVKIGAHSTSKNAIKLWTNYAINAVKFFKKYGGEHAKTKKLHPEVLTWPIELQRAVVQGWLEGDGTVKKTAGGWLSVSTSSADLHSQMNILLTRIGCVYSTHQIIRSGRKRIREANGGYKIVSDSTKKCVSYVTTINAVEAEKVIVDTFMEAAWRSAKSGKKNKFLEFRVVEDGIRQPIKKIEKKWFEGLVYNFETEVDHSYVAHCTSVHNSDCWERSLLLSTYRTFIGAPNYCFVPGTEILMADGSHRSIEDVEIGDEVISHEGKARKVLHKFVRDYEGEIKEIYFGHRKTPISVTPNHEFFLLNRDSCSNCGQGLSNSRPSSYKQRINRQLCTDCGRRVRGIKKEILIRKVPAGDLKKRDIVYAPISRESGEGFGVRFAKLLGYYLADGWRDKNRNSLSFCLGSHEKSMFREIIDAARFLDPDARAAIQQCDNTDNAIIIKIYSKFLANKLEECGGKKSYGKKLSQSYLNSISREEVLHLIGGYANGDGDLHNETQRLRIVSTSLDLLQQIQYLALRAELNSFIVPHSIKVGDKTEVSYSNGATHIIECKRPAWVLHFDTDSSKKLSETLDPAKRQTRKTNSGSLKFIDDKRIESITKVDSRFYQGKVYNLEVDVDHSFVVEGVASVPQCEHIQIPELSKGFIVDAIARDLGNTCYIDILVATDRKHKMLVSDILSGNMSAMSMGCSIAGTLVALSDGTTLPIEEIRPDMEVISQKGNICRVDNLQIRENRWSMRHIEAVGLPAVKFTDNHEFYCVPRDEVEFSTRRGKSRPVAKSYPFELREAGKMEVGDIIATPILQGEVVPQVTESEARLLGLWVGDGWKFENKHDSTVGVGFCLDASEEHSSISDFVESELNRISWCAKEMRLAVGGSVPKVANRYVRRGSNYIVSTSRAVRDLIDRYVVGRRALNKVLTQDVMLWPRSHQLSFISGIIDSDGCVSTMKRGTKQVFISTRNQDLANQFLTILNRCGLIGTLSSVKRKGTKMLPNASGIDHQIRIRNSGVCDIPSDKVKKSNGRFGKKNSGNSDRWIAGNHVYSVVKSITEFDYEGFVYDLQVDNDHSYVANGIGVSNCISLFTTCNKCGNVAVDDSQLCPCILYDGKGSIFTDEQGTQHKIAEIIGHVSVPNSNQFIEASWVRNPAFTGAQRRNILNPDTPAVATAVNQAANTYELRRDEIDLDDIRLRAASRIAQEGEEEPAPETDIDVDAELAEIDAGGDEPAGDEPAGDAPAGDEPAPDDEPAEPEPPKDNFQDLIDQASAMLMENLVENLAKKMAPKPEDVGTAIPSMADANYNETIIGSDFNKLLLKEFPDSPKLRRWASNIYKIVHGQGVNGIKKARLSANDLIVLSWITDRVRHKAYPANLYKLAMAIGPSNAFPSEKSFLAACSIRAGRSLSPDERNFLTWKGRIASLSSKF